MTSNQILRQNPVSSSLEEQLSSQGRFLTISSGGRGFAFRDHESVEVSTKSVQLQKSHIVDALDTCPYNPTMRYAGLGLVSAGVLLLELTLTRVYSVTQGYHFAFLAVSLGLLGFGSSGTVLFIWPNLWERRFSGLVIVSSTLFALSALGGYWVINVVPFDAYRLVLEPEMVVYLTLFYLVPTVPFFFAGLVLGGSLSSDPTNAGRLYAASLVGSGAGALMGTVGPASWGPASALGVVALLGIVGASAFTFSERTRSYRVVVASGLALALAGWFWIGQFDLGISPYKGLPQLLRRQGSESLFTGWNAFSRIDLVRAPTLHQAPGLSMAYAGDIPPQSAMTVDGDRVTTLTAVSPENATFTEYLPAAVVYALHPSPRVLIVEPGGGLDVLTALHHGAEEVVVLMGNPLEARMVTSQFSDVAGDIFSRPEVTVVANNPRAYLNRHDDLFDVIAISLTDTFRPIIAGAYSLGENYLYTREAVGEYLDHLKPGGQLIASRWVQAPPSEEIRLAATIVESIEGRSDDPLAHIAAIRTLQTLTLVAGREPFSPDHLGRIREFAGSRRMDLSHLAGLDTEELNRFFVLDDDVYFAAIRDLGDGEARQAFYGSQEFDVTPATDDRPYFFHFFRWSQLPVVIDRLGKQWQPFGGAGFLVVIAFLVVSIVVSVVLIVVPLLIKQVPSVTSSRGYSWGALFYFFLLGLCFLWVEIPLMQRFIVLLDQPTYSFGIVLFAVLVFSGVGSLFSSMAERRLVLLTALLAMLVAVYALGLGIVIQQTLGLSLPLRIVLAVVTIAPLAVLMGIPFPGGLSALARRDAGLIPWAWGANGYASVVGSVVGALMALSLGFSWAMMAAAGGYLMASITLSQIMRVSAVPGARK